MYSRTFNAIGSLPRAMATHLVEGLPWVRISKLINIADVSMVVGEAKASTPLIESDVEVLVQETESGLLFLICIWHEPNIIRETTKKLKRHAFICLTSLINKMMQPGIITKQIEIISNT